MTFIPYGRQSVDEDDIAAVTAVLRGDWLTTGPAVLAFERDLAAACRAAQAVAVNSGTAALHTAYAAFGLGEGDAIVTTPMTFAATANAARYLGATVRFADIRRDTGNIDPTAVEAAISRKTKLIVAVDFAGHPADYDALNAIASAHGIGLIADASHSIGATVRGTPVGALVPITTTSFHPVKLLTTAEGGAVLCHDEALAERARRFRNHGLVRDPAVMEVSDGPWYYEVQSEGFNYRMPDVLCALGSSQLTKLPSFLQRRRMIARTYLEELADTESLILPTVREGIDPSWHLFVVRVRDASKRRAFFERLRALALGVQVHYIPVHRHPWYRSHAVDPLPRAEDFYATCLSLPIFPAMTDEQVSQVLARVRTAVADVL